MKKLMQIIVSCFCLLQANLVFARTWSANKVRLEAVLGQPVMLADKKQVSYLQVELTGFKLPCERDRAPLNIAIVIDKSGSMNGDKIAKTKEAAIMAVGRLNPLDSTTLSG